MKAFELAAEFARILAADAEFGSAFSGGIKTAQDKRTKRPPYLVVDCSVSPLDTAGRALAYEARFSAQSHAADDSGATPSDAAHAARVSLIHRKFFGSIEAELTAAKTAITLAMANGGKFTLHNYDAPPPGDATVEDSRFRTDFLIKGIAKVVGAI